MMSFTSFSTAEPILFDDTILASLGLMIEIDGALTPGLSLDARPFLTFADDADDEDEDDDKDDADEEDDLDEDDEDEDEDDAEDDEDDTEEDDAEDEGAEEETKSV